MARKGKHHEHQLATSCRQWPAKASIMSISWPPLPDGGPQRPASGASAGHFFQMVARKGQHHEHQPATSSRQWPPKASIMSISRPPLPDGGSQMPASRASAGHLFRMVAREGQHHEHQLATSCRQWLAKGSIMSLSRPPLADNGQRRPAS